ncbi:hypothetical protein AOB58_777 [Staphylococcus sp. AntiMn-1]|uniref:hypothetical protein n=1 Tax=Staphylococcus sp. AntiMn-1 TaxID=1715860 RepID=UPI0007EBBF6C|nr:hypothetical protein [Staphylococcus sp. AntiMn-1]ANK37579.1 hypothetical protein AOB58_777 [Staphylococcus sp. AntiMn-1]
MKIKQKKQLNLPQLIEWAMENEIKHRVFESNPNFDGVTYRLGFDKGGDLYFEESLTPTLLFTVEVEEEIEIDEYTVFHTLVKIVEDGTVYTCTDATINREKNSAVVVIYAKLNGILKLIWTRDKGLVE